MYPLPLQLQIYPKTNTWTCFSSNCNAGSGDQIEMIQRMEGCTKHEAILKGKYLIDPMQYPLTEIKTQKMLKNEIPTLTSGNEPKSLPRIAVLTKYYQSSLGAIGRSKRAIEYAKSRNLNTAMDCPQTYHVKPIDPAAGQYGAQLDLKSDAAADQHGEDLKFTATNSITLQAGFRFSSDGTGTFIATTAEDCPEATANYAIKNMEGHTGVSVKYPQASYQYDSNGNITYDPARDVTITYILNTHRISGIYG